MKNIYIPSLNVLFIFFFKSGSSLYTAFIENWLKWLKIDYDYSELTIVESKNPKVYLMVRNPLERVVTSFYWTKTFDIKSKEDKFPVDDFCSFINGLEDEINITGDNHLLPQTWNMVKGLKRRERQSYELTYEDFSNFDYRTFYPNLNISIVQLESFQKNFAALLGMSTQMMFYPYFQKFDSNIVDSVYYNKTFGQFSELNTNMDAYQKLYVVFLYNFIESAFKLNTHHNNLTGSMIEILRKQPDTTDILIKANKLVDKECKYFGYNNKQHLNKHKFGII